MIMIPVDSVVQDLHYFLLIHCKVQFVIHFDNTEINIVLFISCTGGIRVYKKNG